jgi:adenylate cyclase
VTEQSADLTVLVAFGDLLAVATSLDDVIDVALHGIDRLLGHAHSILLLHEPDRDRLVTLASRGYRSGGVGSEVAFEEGIIGMAAARRVPMRIGNLQRMLSYAQAAHEPESGTPVAEIRLPGLADARSQLAAPMAAGDSLVGVLAVESSVALAYDQHHQDMLTIAAHLVSAALEREHDIDTETPAAIASAPRSSDFPGPTRDAAPVVLRHYAVDGSTFLDDDYVIKGVAGRLLWKLASEHVTTGRTTFTNREAKLDPILELPPYRDNFESRLILLKRRLDDHQAPLRIRSTSRGRFELDLNAPLILDHVDRP